MVQQDDSQQEIIKAVIEWFDHILKQKRWDPKRMAKESKLAPSTLYRILKNDEDYRFVPSLKTLRKVSEGTGYPVPNALIDKIGAFRYANALRTSDAVQDSDDEALEEAGGGTTATAEEVASPAADRVQPARRPVFSRELDEPTRPERATPPGRTRVRFISSLPKSLHPVSNLVNFVPSIPQIGDDETAFAFYMPDTALNPAIKPGTLMYASLFRDPIPDDVVLVTDVNGRSQVRVFAGMDSDGILLSDYKDVLDTVPFNDVREIAIVVATVKA